jgi:hypothetical protein
MYGSCVIHNRWSRTAKLRDGHYSLALLPAYRHEPPNAVPTVEALSFFHEVGGCGSHIPSADFANKRCQAS